MFREYKHYESKLKENMAIWLAFISFSCIITISGISGSFLNVLAFPMNAVLLYLIIQSKEHKRAATFLKKQLSR